MSFTDAERAYFAEQRLGRVAMASARADTDADGRRVIRITPEVIWSWGINVGAPKHFAGMIERRTVER